MNSPHERIPGSLRLAKQLAPDGLRISVRRRSPERVIHATLVLLVILTAAPPFEPGLLVPRLVAFCALAILLEVFGPSDTLMALRNQSRNPILRRSIRLVPSHEPDSVRGSQKTAYRGKLAAAPEQATVAEPVIEIDGRAHMRANARLLITAWETSGFRGRSFAVDSLDHCALLLVFPDITGESGGAAYELERFNEKGAAICLARELGPLLGVPAPPEVVAFAPYDAPLPLQGAMPHFGVATYGWLLAGILGAVGIGASAAKTGVLGGALWMSFVGGFLLVHVAIQMWFFRSRKVQASKRANDLVALYWRVFSPS